MDVQTAMMMQQEMIKQARLMRTNSGGKVTVDFLKRKLAESQSDPMVISALKSMGGSVSDADLEKLAQRINSSF